MTKGPWKFLGGGYNFTGKWTSYGPFSPGSGKHASLTVHHGQTGAIIGAGGRKSWDLPTPMMWDNLSIFRINCTILTTFICTNPRIHVVGSRMDIVMLHDQMVKTVRFSSGFFTAMTGKKKGSSVYFYAELMKKIISVRVRATPPPQSQSQSVT